MGRDHLSCGLLISDSWQKGQKGDILKFKEIVNMKRIENK